MSRILFEALVCNKCKKDYRPGPYSPHYLFITGFEIKKANLVPMSYCTNCSSLLDVIWKE